MEQAGQDSRTEHAAVLAVALGLAFGLLSGFIMPNRWAATSLLFDYDLGFSKRALFGAALGLVSDRVSYAALAILSFAIMAGWIALLFALCRQAAQRGGALAWYVLAAFFISHGFSYALHVVGYLDHFGLLLALACLLLPVSAGWAAVRLAACLVMVLVHEGLLLSAVPLVLFDAAFRGTLAGQGKAAFRATLLIGIVVLGLAWFLGQGALDPAMRPDLLRHLAARAADFPILDDAVEVLFRDTDRNAATMAFLRGSQSVERLLRAVEMDAPYTLLVAGLAIWVMSRAPLAGRPVWMAAIAACAGAPLAVTILAWDYERFAAQTQTSATILLLVVLRAANGVRVPQVALVLLAAASVYNAAGRTALFGEIEMRRPPFSSALGALADHIRADKPLFRHPH